MSERFTDWGLDNKIFISSFIFSIGFVARPLLDFWILGRYGCFKTWFLAYLIVF